MCAAAIISAVVTALVPSGNLEKSVKTVVSVFLIMSMVKPFIEKNSAVNKDISKNIDAYDESYDETVTETECRTAEYLKSSICTLLSENGISCDDIIVQCEMNSGEISFGSVTVVNPSADDETVKKIIKEQLGTEVIVD